MKAHMNDLLNGLKTQAQEVAQTFGGNVSKIQFCITPDVFEDSAAGDQERWDKGYDKTVWNGASAKRKAAELIELGWKQRWDSDMGGVRYICLTLDPENPAREYCSDEAISLHIHYQPTKEDRCAALKKQLAELGCHY